MSQSLALSAILTVMEQAKRIERKVFLAWALGSTSAAVLGCSDDAGDTPAGGGAAAGGSAGSGGLGTAGTGGSAAGSSSGGTFSSAGTSGGTTPVGGGGASSAGTGGAGGSGGAAVTPDCSTKLKVFISADHGHVLDVTAADVMAGVAKSYDAKGKSDHSHWIQLLPADFAKLQAGMAVHKLSCNSGHEHEFIVNCIGVEKPETTSGVPGFCDAGHTCADAMGNYCPELP